MAAYLVCHGTTPPEEVQACGTAGWPNRRLAPNTDVTAMKAVREHLALSASRSATRRLSVAGAGAAALLAVVAAAAILVRSRKSNADLLL